jgi:hypothetical protein
MRNLLLQLSFKLSFDSSPPPAPLDTTPTPLLQLSFDSSPPPPHLDTIPLVL